MSRTLLLGCVSLLALATTAGIAAAPHHPAAPAAPPAAPAPAKAAPAPALPAPTGAAVNYDVKSVEISEIYGTVHVAVSDRGPVTLAISGPKSVTDNIRVTSSGGLLHVTDAQIGNHVWNWSEWFDFKREHREKVILTLSVPKGSSFSMDDFVGDFNIGDLNGPVKIGAAAAEGSVGNVTRADIDLAGSGKITVGTVSQDLKIDIAGSGTVTTGASANAAVEIGGSGDAHLGPVLGGLHVEIAGEGDVTVVSVNGPTHTETAGQGSIKIETGEANPLHVEIVGSGDFTFGGEAVDPHIEAMGEGNVTLKSYRGKLSTEGMTHVKIGSNP